MSRGASFRIGADAAAGFGVGLRRDRAVAFRFDGRDYAGFEGDSLASALLANGVRTVGRSFKFHRPRGVHAAGAEEPNALVQLGAGARAVPSERATLLELRPGLEVSSQAGWPGVGFDLGRVLDFTAPLWPAGFYNKTFIWPKWHSYEWLVRRMAGSGRSPEVPDPDRYEVRHLHCEVLVVGGGVAGLRAAEAAAVDGARVVLAEQDAQLGGRAAWDGSSVDGVAAAEWIGRSEQRLARLPELRLLRRTTAVGCYEQDVVALLERVPPDPARPGAPRERYWIVRAGRVVLATGAIEQPLVFCNNDRPGIFLAGAARQYLRRHGVAVGRRVVIATNNDSAYALAHDLRAAGVDVLAVADTRREVPAALAEALQRASVPLLTATIPVDSTGFGGLRGVALGRLSPDAQRIESVRRYRCDALAVSGGWNPTLHLYSQAGGRLAYSGRTGALAPVEAHPRFELAGAAADPADAPPGLRVSPAGNPRRQWVDLRHDVTVADLQLAVRENFSAIEHVKRYTTVGMSADQGKTSNLAALEIVAGLRGTAPAQIGHTTFRPPFMPVTLGALAGRSVGARFAPERRLPMHDWHLAHGAAMEDYGDWKRPAAYLRPGESQAQAIQREARTVRTAAGLLDSSSLGKLEVHGPDALAFLDRFYLNDMARLKPGRARYGIMLHETGIVFDDGTVTVLAPDRCLVTTTSGNAGRIADWLEEWHQCEWPELRVAVIPVTEQWATFALAGPRARDILAQLRTDIDLSNAALPHLGVREGRLLDVPARIYRVSYTGELSYEINVPSGAAQAVWQALVEAGRPHGLEPLGMEALLQLRLEKGFLHIGSDTDGTTVPDDVGWGKPAAAKRADYVGKRSLQLPEHLRPDRLQLVGLAGEGGDLVVGGHLRLAGSQAPSDGWITSAGRTALGDAPVALAMLRGGRARLGEVVTVHDVDGVTRARVTEPVFHDPAGERMHA